MLTRQSYRARQVPEGAPPIPIRVGCNGTDDGQLQRFSRGTANIGPVLVGQTLGIIEFAGEQMHPCPDCHSLRVT